MEKSSVFHQVHGLYCYSQTRDSLTIRVRTNINDFKEIIVNYKNLYDHTEDIYHKTMDILLVNEDYAIYETSITIKEKHFKYFFSLIDYNNKTYYYTSDGFLNNPKQDNYFYYPQINDDDIINLPKWAEGEIIYQILIDRFYDGDYTNNPIDVQSWDSLPSRNTYYGGDFKGVINKLDYLSSYGVKMIYLSPIFKSPNYHKYDIVDYYQIESIYGSKDDLIDLVNKAHEKGMKIILDVVYNHCSSLHPFFQDLLKYQKNSIYKNWFKVENYPISIAKGNYDNFANQVPSMPKFNTANPEVIEYLVTQALYWAKELKIDGYRLDVSDEVAHIFWKILYQRLTAFNPEFIIIGEIWNHATKWLGNVEMHTTTNYKLRQNIIDFMTGDQESKDFIKRYNENKSRYLTPHYTYLISLLGSHDTIRLRTKLNSDLTNHLALRLMLMLEGIPLIYYGDEIGMEGNDDPDNRRAMKWDYIQTQEIIETKRFAVLRANNECLKKGKTSFIESQSRVIKFFRDYKNSRIMVILNLSDSDVIESTPNLRDIFSGVKSNVVKPKSIRVFISE
ncbi:MAG: alpha amylase N-terminal ig-like domain-containing protein [Candidatus Izemoplasmatales bacterium]|nr:alpha amylase N-terminal ig-like domain-containing protein [Candidatus Izemoplasmatales bacterium]MDY0138160.1 alpha amylase N-terminal ig-like domain-containing protein [Candidatus Izemoplasmatales bacterium]